MDFFWGCGGAEDLPPEEPGGKKQKQKQKQKQKNMRKVRAQDQD